MACAVYSSKASMFRVEPKVNGKLRQNRERFWISLLAIFTRIRIPGAEELLNSKFIIYGDIFKRKGYLELECYELSNLYFVPRRFRGPTRKDISTSCCLRTRSACKVGTRSKFRVVTKDFHESRWIWNQSGSALKRCARSKGAFT